MSKPDLKETLRQNIEIIDFFKEAFCVDGQVTLDFEDISKKNCPVFTLRDSKRGEFRIAYIN